MSQAISLLILAIQLLTAVANAPTLPPDVRDNAIRVANIALAESYAEMPQATPSPVVQNTEISVQPASSQPILFGSVAPVDTSCFSQPLTAAVATTSNYYTMNFRVECPIAKGTAISWKITLTDGSTIGYGEASITTYPLTSYAVSTTLPLYIAIPNRPLVLQVNIGDTMATTSFPTQ